MADKVKKRKATYEIKGIKVTYEELYKVNDSNEEVFDRDIEIQNDLNLYDAYKEYAGLLKSSDIKTIRNKYKMSQKDYSLCLGMGEVSVNRFERGAIQTDTIDNLLRMSSDPNNMLIFLEKNKDSFNKTAYKNILENINKKLKFDEHKIAKLDFLKLRKLKFNEENIFDICSNVIYYYNKPIKDIEEKYNINIMNDYITNLKLQKLLYYVQGLSLIIYKRRAFSNKIVAWNYGPVVKEAYEKYKANENQTIASPKKIPQINEGMLKIINIVVNSYGKIDAYNLINLTHEEDPWINSDINKEIDLELIQEYFENVYC